MTLLVTQTGLTLVKVQKALALTEAPCPTCHLRKIFLLPKGKVSPPNNETCQLLPCRWGQAATYLPTRALLTPSPPAPPAALGGKWGSPGETIDKAEPTTPIKGNFNQLKASKHAIRKENKVLLYFHAADNRRELP